MGAARDRLAALGIALPAVPAPAAAYVPFSRVGNLVYTAGQIPITEEGLLATGKLGGEVDLASGQAAARRCAINILAIADAVAGDLDRVRVVKLTVFVAAVPTFTQAHLVANGASELLGEVLGDAGAHARSAVGVPVLPLDVPVEVEAILAVD